MKNAAIPFMLTALVTLLSCDPEPLLIEQTVGATDNNHSGMFILSEGLFNQNNSSLSWIDFSTGLPDSWTDGNNRSYDSFLKANGRRLGDTANDMLLYGSRLYIAVSESSTIEVVDAATCRSIKQLSMMTDGKAGQPRRLTAYEGFVYVCSFDGTVSRIDTLTLVSDAVVRVGRNPDGICCAAGKLYVSNSGGLDFNRPDSTVSVIDTKTFTEIARITVHPNPGFIYADNNSVYVISRGIFDYGTMDYDSRLHRIDTGTDQVKIYWDAYKMEINPSYSGYPSVRRQILEELDRGALVVNYIGHGSGDVLSHELVLNKKDAVTLTSPRLPFWITASCDIAPFDAPLESFGMNLIKNEKGGAIGVLSTTRTVLASHNRLMTSSFSKYILSYGDDGVQNSVGDALRLTKNELVTPSGEYTDYSVNKIHYVLLGDPALKLGMARMTAVLDSFSHKPASADSLMAMAGSVIEVQGHIEADGVIDNNFSGKLFASVYDSEREVICLNNAKAATTPFRFMYRDRILYSGTDSVRNGRFTFSFPVPLDINYSGEPGRISLYASEEEGKRAASGFFENFLVGGTNSLMKTDTVGPKVSLYLNTPSFRFGGAVNSTPVLVAEISDESGINTSGNGLGHDMLLMIDNDPIYTWVLNGYFTSNAGDYTGGRVVFNLPPLPEGKHRLMLRVWDVMNNSTVAYLDFKVVEGLKPKFELHTTPNPAKQATTFVVTHDRPGQDALVTVQVYDSGGVLQWTGTTVDTTDSGVSMIPWNLVGSSGRRMQPGLYIIRATVETPGQSEEGKALTEKLVILGR
jgi:YVTN family beta-propeller protein